MYIYTYIYIYMFIYLLIDLCTHTCMYVYLHIHTYDDCPVTINSQRLLRAWLLLCVGVLSNLLALHSLLQIVLLGLRG